MRRHESLLSTALQYIAFTNKAMVRMVILKVKQGMSVGTWVLTAALPVDNAEELLPGTASAGAVASLTALR